MPVVTHDDRPLDRRSTSATTHVEILQTQYIDKVGNVPAVTQRQAPRPAINQATKHAEIPQTQNTPTRLAVSPVAMHSDRPLRPPINQATKHVEILQTQYIDNVDNMPVVMARHVPQLQTVLKTRRVPQVQFGSVCTNRSTTCECPTSGDQACRASASSAHRQGRRRAGGDAKAGSSGSEWAEDGGSPGCIEEALSDRPLPSSAEEQPLRMAMLMPDTRAMWESISQLSDSADKGRAAEAAMRPPPATAGVGAGVRCTTAVAADSQ